MYARTMAERICRLRSLFGADSDIGYTTHKWYTTAMILCVADAAVKLDKYGVCQCGEGFRGAGFSLWGLVGARSTLLQLKPTS
jgi:hypothetical protein